MSDVANKVHLKDHRPKVSVIIPVYNTEKYLARCLDSVVGQTGRDLEIICVNDGSTDGSAAILERYAATDDRIKIITQENGGLSAARNSGLDVATGEYVMFVDSDDWLPADAAAKFLKAAEESGAPVVVSAEYAKDHLKKPRRTEVRWALKRPALKRLVGQRKIQSSACNKFYRADIIHDRRFIPGIYFEDWPFITELFGDIESFALVDEPMYVYFTGGTSIVHSSFTEKKVMSYQEGIRHVTAYFEHHPMRKYAMKRVDIAKKMLKKRAKKAGLAFEPPSKSSFSQWILDICGLICRRKLSPDEQSQSMNLRNDGLTALRVACEALQELKLKFHVDFGTLLGLVRSGGFIGHDVDIDISVYEDCDYRILKSELQSKGFEFARAFEYEGRITEITMAYKGLHVDFFMNFQEGANQYYFVCGRFDKKIRYPHRTKQVVKCLRPVVTDFRVRKFAETVDVPIPTNAEELLEREYGKTWRIPNPNWSIDFNDGFRFLMPGLGVKISKFNS